MKDVITAIFSVIIVVFFGFAINMAYLVGGNKLMDIIDPQEKEKTNVLDEISVNVNNTDSEMFIPIYWDLLENEMKNKIKGDKIIKLFSTLDGNEDLRITPGDLVGTPPIDFIQMDKNKDSKITPTEMWKYLVGKFKTV